MRVRRFVPRIRRAYVVTAAVLVAFLVALLVWTNGLGLTGPGSHSGHGATALGGGGQVTGSVQPSPTPGTGGALDAGAPGFASSLPSLVLPPGSTGTVGTYPTKHDVVITVRSNLYAGAIGYVVRGYGKAVAHYNVQTPWVRHFVVNRPAYVAAVTVQVAADQVWASCQITVDGHSQSYYVARGPYEVVTCVA